MNTGAAVQAINGHARLTGQLADQIDGDSLTVATIDAWADSAAEAANALRALLRSAS